MTTSKFISFGFLALVLTTLVKLFFISWLDINNIYIVYIMWALVALVTIGCCRRLGVITYLESILVFVTWFIAQAFFDLLIISTVAGPGIYAHLYLWISYLVMIVCVFLFHKKRHVEIRHIQRAEHSQQTGHY